MPKYVLMFIGSSDAWERVPEAERQKLYAAAGQWFGEHRQAGRIIGGEELQHTRTATTVRFKEGKAIVSDGPYTEAKEHIGGFAIVNVPDLDAALAMAKTWPTGGTVEVRPLVEH